MVEAESQNNNNFEDYKTMVDEIDCIINTDFSGKKSEQLAQHHLRLFLFEIQDKFINIKQEMAKVLGNIGDKKV